MDKIKTLLSVHYPQARVSRSQLLLILEKVGFQVFDRLIFESFGINLSAQERLWFAVDGKELRGIIEKGNTRGEAVVEAVSPENCQTVAQDYSGAKESEVPIVRKLLAESGSASQKISLDALHSKPFDARHNQADNGKSVNIIENREPGKKSRAN